MAVYPPNPGDRKSWWDRAMSALPRSTSRVETRKTEPKDKPQGTEKTTSRGRSIEYEVDHKGNKYTYRSDHELSDVELEDLMDDVKSMHGITTTRSRTRELPKKSSADFARVAQPAPKEDTRPTMRAGTRKKEQVKERERLAFEDQLSKDRAAKKTGIQLAGDLVQNVTRVVGLESDEARFKRLKDSQNLSARQAAADQNESQKRVAEEIAAAGAEQDQYSLNGGIGQAVRKPATDMIAGAALAPSNIAANVRTGDYGAAAAEAATFFIPQIARAIGKGNKFVNGLIRKARGGDPESIARIERELAKLPEYQKSANVVDTPKPRSLAEIVAKHENVGVTESVTPPRVEMPPPSAIPEGLGGPGVQQGPKPVGMPPPVAVPEGLGGSGLPQGPAKPQSLAEIVAKHEGPEWSTLPPIQKGGIPDGVDPAVYYDSLLEDVDPMWTRAELEAWSAKHDVPIYRSEARWADLQDETVDLEPFARQIDAGDLEQRLGGEGAPSSHPTETYRDVIRQLNAENEGGAGREFLNEIAPIIRAIDKAKLSDARKLDLLNWFGKNDVTDINVARRVIAEAEANPKFRFRESEDAYFGETLDTPQRRLERVRSLSDDETVSATQYPDPLGDAADSAALHHNVSEPSHYYDRQPAKPSEPPKVEPDPEDLRNTSHADTDEVREILGLPEREINPETVAEWLRGAKKHAGHESQIARDILASPRVITKTEGIALGRKLNELVRKMGEARSKGDLDAYDLLRSEANEIADGLDAGGSEWGRSGRARQQLLAEDYSDFGIKRRAEKAAASIDETVPPAVQKELDELRAKLEAKDAELAEHQANAATAELVKKKRFRASDDVAKDIEAAWKELRAAASKASANPLVDPEIWTAFGKLVKLEVEAGASKLEDLVARLLEHTKRAGIDASESDIRRAIAGLDKPETTPRSVKAGVQRLRDLKREAALIEQIENIDATPPRSPKHARTKSKRVEQLEKELAELQGTRRDADRLEVKRINSEQRVIHNERAAWEKARAQEATRKTPEELKANRDAQYKLDLEAQIGDLQDQIRTGELKKRVSKKREYDNVTENLLFEREKLQREVDAKIEDLGMTRGQKILRGAGRFGENVRGTILGSDFGILLRQGLFSIARPKAYGKGIKAALRGGLSDARLAAIERELDLREIDGMLARRMEKEAGLQRTTSHRTLNEQEELVLARLFKKLPEWAAAGMDKLGAKGAADVTRKVGDATAGSLLRAQHAFINTVRAETFDQAVRAGFDARELRLRAQFINNATGRSNAKNVPQSLSVIMTSPRYERSRWGLLWEPIKNVSVGSFDVATGKGLNRAVLANLHDMGVTAASVYTVFRLAEHAGYEVEWDTTSADFLKLRRGEEVWDVTAGIAPRLRDVFRAIVATLDPDHRKNLSDIGGAVAMRAVSPATKTPYEQGSIAYQKSQGAKEPKSPLTGFKDDEKNTGLEAFMPLIMQSFLQNLHAEGMGSAVSAGAREFIGTSVNRYPKGGKWGENKPSVKKQRAKRREALIPPD